MHRQLTCLLLALLLLLPAGCGTAQTDAAAEAADALTFTDDLGRTVTVEEPQRVAALIGSFADIWCLAGGQETLVAAAHDTWTNFDLGLSDAVADLGAVSEPSLETLLAAAPDLVLASCNTDADLALLDTLEAAGITTAYFAVSGFSDYLRMLEICTAITGCAENYELYGTQVAAQVEAAKAMADGSQPTVLYVRASASSCRVKNSADSVLGEMLLDLDTVNIADSDGSLLENLSLEVILAADPDYIFLVLQGADKEEAQANLEQTLLSSPAWQSLTAVQAGRCYVLDSSLYNLKPNARWGEAYENLAEILYGG